MKALFLAIVALVLCSSYSSAHPDFKVPKLTVSAGVKFGYQWSSNSGTFIGFELSTTVFHDKFFYGLVYNYDKTDYGTKSHFGVQMSGLYGGGEIGPSFIHTDSVTVVRAIGASVFTGLFIFPSYSLTIGEKNFYSHEANLLLKLHMPVEVASN
ncbi:MAG: hypothetical protein JNJ85_00805 [Candidatus Kapabacteria bacterium]|nr:hypothetical protein [Candidatus Kapabacteria bacterium]